MIPMWLRTSYILIILSLESPFITVVYMEYVKASLHLRGIETNGWKLLFTSNTGEDSFPFTLYDEKLLSKHAMAVSMSYSIDLVIGRGSGAENAELAWSRCWC